MLTILQTYQITSCDSLQQRLVAVVFGLSRGSQVFIDFLHRASGVCGYAFIFVRSALSESD